MTGAAGSLVILAAKGGEAAKSGPWGLAIILLLAVVCYFLFKSMSKHLRRVRERFPDQRPPGSDGAPPPRTTGAAPPAEPPA